MEMAIFTSARQVDPLLAKYNGAFTKFDAYSYLTFTFLGLFPFLCKGKLNRVKAKCPPHLHNSLSKDMITVGWGVTVRAVLFFLPFVWGGGISSGGAMPEYARDDNGNTCYISKNINGEYYIRRANGSESPVRNAGSQLIDSDGNYYYQ